MIQSTKILKNFLLDYVTRHVMVENNSNCSTIKERKSKRNPEVKVSDKGGITRKNHVHVI